MLPKTLIGDRAQNWIDKIETLEPLITAYQKLADSAQDSRSPILYAGNAFESFLVKLAQHYNVNLANASGINSKVDTISNSGFIKTKHKFMSKYLGHIRNACDHGLDGEIGQAWSISPKTSHEYVHITMSCIDVMVDSVFGIFRV